MVGNIPDIVAHELQIGQRGFGLYVAACLDIQFTDVDSECLKSQPREFNGVPPLETAQVGDAKVTLFTGKCRIENAFCGQKPGMGIHRLAGFRFRVASVVETYVMGRKSNQRTTPSTTVCLRPQAAPIYST